MQYLRLIRIKHWLKNALVFVPLLCSGAISANNLLVTALGFLAFSLASSFIYCINDLKDIEKDRLHPTKKNRPLASGKISKRGGVAAALTCLAISIGLSVFLIMQASASTTWLPPLLLSCYVLINLAYSLGAKNIAILDIVLLAAGFVLRIYYGAALTGIEVSNWLFLTITNAALFLGLGKRRKELETSKHSRKVLEQYPATFLEQFFYLTLGLSIVFYSLWAMEQANRLVIFSVPILTIIFMRYCLVLERDDEGDPTTVIYSDAPLMLICIAYLLYMLAVVVMA